jgi:hypothetical protein
MRKLLLIASAAVVLTAAAHAAPPPPDTLPGTIHFDSGASTVKAKPGKHRKYVKRTGNSTLNRNALHDGTGRQ